MKCGAKTGRAGTDDDHVMVVREHEYSYWQQCYFKSISVMYSCGLIEEGIFMGTVYLLRNYSILDTLLSIFT